MSKSRAVTTRSTAIQPNSLATATASYQTTSPSPKEATPSTLKASNKSKRLSKRPICDLCAGPIEQSEDLLNCITCKQNMHRYCAGVTRTYFAKLTESSSTFRCWPCSLMDLQSSSVNITQIKETVVDLTIQVAKLQNDLNTQSSQHHSDCSCQQAVSAIEDDVNELKAKCTSYADILKSKVPGRYRNRPKHANTMEDPSKQAKKKPKISISGSRKIWGTKKADDVNSIKRSLSTYSCIKDRLKEITIKRKFKSSSANKKLKWWFVLRGDESVMETLTDNWKIIKDQKGWQLEPVLRFEEDSETNPISIEEGPENQETSSMQDKSLHSTNLDPVQDEVPNATDDTDIEQRSILPTTSPQVSDANFL